MGDNELEYYSFLFDLPDPGAKSQVFDKKEIFLILALKNMKGRARTVKPETIKAIETILSKGDRVELIPGPNGSVKVIHIKRKTIKTEHVKECLEC